MKPLRLSLQAFGSYAGSFSVDFSRLGRHGIFAITGPTGAGKSTIFDALVYALYDDLPGFRENGNVRSQFAAAVTETVVRLDFESHGQPWRIERAPAQLVAARRGRGATVERKSRATLTRLDADGVAVAGTTVARKPQVKAAVEELVGLTKEQFEQVVLIPQGKFEEVLKADTGRRAPLLRRLFPVEAFGRVTEALKGIAAGRQAAYEEAARREAALRGRVHDVLVAVVREASAGTLEGLPGAGASLRGVVEGGFRPEELDAYVDEVVRLRVALDRRVDETLVAAATARDLLARARAASARWERWQADLGAAASFADDEAEDEREASRLETARRLSDLRGALERWKEATARRRDADAAWAKCRDGLERAWVAGYDRGCLPADAAAADVRRLAHVVAADAARLSEEASRFDRLAAAAASLDARAAALGDRQARLSGRMQRLRSEEAALAELAASAEALREEAAGDARAEGEADALDRELRAAERRTELVAEAETLRGRLDAARAAAERSRGRLAGVRAAWRDGLAGRLARLLVDGEPCPTCGALDHPVPAPQREGARPIDDKVLAEAESECQRAEEVWRAAERRAGEAAGELASLAPARPLPLVEQCLEQARTRLVAMRAAGERARGLRAEHDRRRDDLDREQRAVAEERREVDLGDAALRAERAAFEKERAEFAAVHGAFLSPSAAASARSVLASRLEALADSAGAREDARLAADTCDAVLRPVLAELGLDEPAGLSGLVLRPAELAARADALAQRCSRRAEVRARLATYEADGGPVDRPDVRPLEEASERAERTHRELVGRQAVVMSLAREVAAAPALLEAAAKELAESRRALEEARTVAATCGGSGPAAACADVVVATTTDGRRGTAAAVRHPPARISLENWVLADYLRQVLAHANVRLASMTDGRFSLQLSDGVTDGRKPWGLDLSAFDVHTGQVRPATTLSGGETFMGALALALGLADVVSGGSNRHIGALFVDEGFGSLDPQALDAVIDVLRALEDGGRVVGVISHVEDVQRALPTGISVRPSVGGSVAEVHYPDG